MRKGEAQTRLRHGWGMPSLKYNKSSSKQYFSLLSGAFVGQIDLKITPKITGSYVQIVFAGPQTGQIHDRTVKLGVENFLVLLGYRYHIRIP